MNQQGVSLIDLLLVCAVLGLLGRWALPNLSQTYHQSRADQYLRAQQQVLNLGRSLANVSRSKVIVCPSFNGQQCSTDWTLPQLLFVDRNANGQRDATENLVLHQRLVQSGQQLSWNGFTGNRQIAIVPVGGGYHQNGTFRFCTNDDARFARTLIVQRNGRYRSGLDTNQNGIVEDASGQDLRCPLP